MELPCGPALSEVSPDVLHPSGMRDNRRRRGRRYIAMNQPDPFYLSRRWQKLRASILRRDGYLCQVSKRYGKFVQAEVVHHVFPRDEFPEYEWEPWNLVSVTKAAHQSLHDRTNGLLSAAGVDLLRRTARKNGVEVPLRYQ